MFSPFEAAIGQSSAGRCAAGRTGQRTAVAVGALGRRACPAAGVCSGLRTATGPGRGPGVSRAGSTPHGEQVRPWSCRFRRQDHGRGRRRGVPSRVRRTGCPLNGGRTCAIRPLSRELTHTPAAWRSRSGRRGRRVGAYSENISEGGGRGDDLLPEGRKPAAPPTVPASCVRNAPSCPVQPSSRVRVSGRASTHSRETTAMAETYQPTALEPYEDWRSVATRGATAPPSTPPRL